MAEIRHCLMAGMCQAAEEVEDMHFSTSGRDYGYKCCGSSDRNNHRSSCISNAITPAKFRCPATVASQEHCERKWMEGLS